MYRFSLIGAGFIGGVHAASLAGHPDVDFAQVYDIDADRAAALAARHGASVTTDLDWALDPTASTRSHRVLDRHPRDPPACRGRCRACGAVRKADRSRS